MLKSREFLREKSRGRAGGGGTSVCSVILRRYSLLEVPWRRIHNVIAHAMSVCVAVDNKVEFDVGAVDAGRSMARIFSFAPSFVFVEVNQGNFRSELEVSDFVGNG